jgi:hypothetical protein
VKPRRIRRSKPYRLIVRKSTRYIAVKLRGGRQRTSKQTTREEARAWAYRLISTTREDLARELGIDFTPALKGLHTNPLSPS